MRSLKLLVVGMAVLILIGLVVLVFGIYQKANKTYFSEKQAKPYTVLIPKGSKIVEMDFDAGKLVLRLKFSDGRHQVLVIEASTGRVLEKISLKRML